jgi:thioesterase domain-containing protein
MQTTVKKEELLVILRENREAHRDEFERAVEGYRQRKLAQLEDQIEAIQKGRIHERFESLPVPTDHTMDYDRVIRLVELDIHDTLTLEEHEVAQFVMDDWQWKREFRTTNSYYVQ